MLERDDIDAVYMPLPTGLHAEWVPKALESGKHLLVEKSFAESAASAEQMIALAREKNLLVLENYPFLHHSQHEWVLTFLAAGHLGDVHLLRSTFGFPPLARDNFRYDRELGGGALLDAGGYVLKAAQAFLGPEASLAGAVLHYDNEHEVDIYGEAMLRGAGGKVAQVAFGFDYFYQCRYELLGTKGKLFVDRAFTPPPGLRPVVRFEEQDRTKEFVLPADNHYRNMLSFFSAEAGRPETYEAHWEEALQQARLIEALRREGTKWAQVLR
jgi:predicted dehydrogenase